MTYTVIYTARTRQDLRKLSPGDARRIIRAVAGIREHLYGHLRKLAGFSGTPVYRLRVLYGHLRKLAGFSGTPVYRLRVGEYRAVLAVEDERLLILVLEARNRSGIYR